MNASQKFLGPPLTGAYQPAVYGWGFLQSLFTGQVPMFLLGEVEAMRADPQVQMAMAIIRSPLHQLKWTVQAANPEIAKFVDREFGKIWRTSMRKMTAYLEYGNAAAEVLYKTEQGRISFDCLRDVYPRDAVPLVRNGSQVGVQVRGNAWPITQGGEQAQTPGCVNLFPPRAFWVAHRARHGNFFGYSRYQGAWWPWLEKRGRHGATDVRRMWYIKNCYRGMRIRHPPGYLALPNGGMMSCQDYAREIVEKAETGGVLALPNAKDPTSGEYLWVVEDAAINGDLSGVREYAGDLDREILEGFEIPPEVAEAAEVGAGWSGRSVPFMVFLTGEDELVAELIAAIVQWILTPLVEVNFGVGQLFSVEPVSLVELLAQAAPDGKQPTDAPPSPDRPPSAQRVQMSLDQERDSAARVLDGILDRGTQAGIVAADEVRRKIRALVKKKLPLPETLKAARKIIAVYEPILAATFSDTLLASWLAGAKRVVDGLPPFPSEVADPWYSSAGLAPALGVGSEEPPPPFVRGVAGQAEPEPVVHFPIVEDAARDLARRRIVTRPEFDALANEAKTTAFTAARVGSEQALARLSDALRFNVREGQTLKEFAAVVEEALGEGESGLSPGHIENVYRTNCAQAYSTGLMETLNHPLVADEFPYLAYHACHDSRTRVSHLKMETLGLNRTNVYRRDDPIWQRFTPPWDYQCRCALVPLTVEDAAKEGVREAKEWMRSGSAPSAPEWVAPPPFDPPPGWSVRVPVRMSEDAEGHEHDARGRFAPKGEGGEKPEENENPRKKWEKEVAKIDALHAEAKLAHGKRQETRDNKRKQLEEASLHSPIQTGAQQLTQTIRNIHDALGKETATDEHLDALRKIEEHAQLIHERGRATLAEHGASAAELTSFTKAAERGKGPVDRKAAGYVKQAQRLREQSAAVQAIAKEEPPLTLDEPEYPVEPDDYDYDETEAGNKKFQADHAAWQKVQDRMEKDYARESEKVEKTWEKWQAKYDAAVSNFESEAEKLEERHDDLQEALDDYFSALDEKADAIYGDIEGRIDAEEEADEEPEEPEYPEEPEEEEEEAEEEEEPEFEELPEDEDIVQLSLYHGPEAPGADWVQVGTGPRGGKIWQRRPPETKRGLLARLFRLKPSSTVDPDEKPASPDELKRRMAKSSSYRKQTAYLSSKMRAVWTRLADAVGKTPQEVQKEAAEKAQKIVDGADVYLRKDDPKVVMAILQDRFKNQFETGESGGTYAPNLRRRVEAKSMGVKEDEHPVSRPLYGYLSAKNFAWPMMRRFEAASQYGDFIFKLKPHVRSRTTVTFGDSLDKEDDLQATPLAEVGHQSASPAEIEEAGGLSALDSHSEWRSRRGSYIEAQIHDGLSPSDIEELRFPNNYNPPQEMLDLLAKQGIQWGTYPA